MIPVPSPNRRSRRNSAATMTSESASVVGLGRAHAVEVGPVYRGAQSGHPVVAFDVVPAGVQVSDLLELLLRECRRIWRGGPLVDVVGAAERRRHGRDGIVGEQPLDGGLSHRPLAIAFEKPQFVEFLPT